MEEEIDKSIVHGKCQPLVFKNKINSWKAKQWTPEYLRKELPDHIFRCKLAPTIGQDCWETDCCHEEITLNEFVEWNDGTSCKGDNPLSKYKKSEWSCYIDYKYMKDVFSKTEAHLKEVDWSVFGFDQRDGEDSTIWIGTAGCYTNCHYDTYGFNLVAQVYGRKRWILFPPSDTNYLYPTRIPYEESSVFSQVDVKRPNLHKFPLFKSSHPYVIDLEPGDVLYVPRHWWHHVECLDTAISINTWVEMEDDKKSLVTEAITRFMFGCLMSVDVESMNNWVNPGEDVQESETNFKFIQQALHNLGQLRVTDNNLTKFASQIQKDVDSKENQKRKVTEHVDEPTHSKMLKMDSDNTSSCQLVPDVTKATLQQTTPSSWETFSDSSCAIQQYFKDEKIIHHTYNIVQQMTFENYYTKTCKHGTNSEYSNKADMSDSSQESTETYCHGDLDDQTPKNDFECAPTNMLDFLTFARSLLHPDVIHKIFDVMKNDCKIK